MARILVINNYSFARVWNEVREGEKPDHHLFGINYFAAAGHEIELAPFERTSSWQTVQRLLCRAHFPIPLGDLEQQLTAWRRRGEIDLVYAPCQTATHILGYLRHLGAKVPPMICLAHHPIETGRIARVRRPFLRASVRGTDLYPSLSGVVSNELNALADRRISEAIPWGPQQNYYQQATGVGEGVVATGRTGRDFDTFGRAATQAGITARIICLKGAVTPVFSEFGRNVTVETHPDTSPVGYRALLAAFSSARVLAIPISASESLAGLTSLTDALGVGRPVIMTRNPFLDLDVETLGIGRWVGPGDVRGWTDALRWFDRHPDEAAKMGQRARALVDAGLHSESFAGRMMKLFERVLSQARRR